MSFGMTKCLEVTPATQLRFTGYQWWSGKTYWAKGPIDVLMQGFHIGLVHPRDVKPTNECAADLEN